MIAQSTRKNSHKVLEQNIQQLELAEEMLNSETKELNLFAKKKKNEVFTKKKNIFIHETRIKFQVFNHMFFDHSKIKYVSYLRQ